MHREREREIRRRRKRREKTPEGTDQGTERPEKIVVNMTVHPYTASVFLR
jgi:hypothetical protein